VKPVRPLLVVGLGGHALSTPDAPPDRALAGERAAAAAAAMELAALAADGFRLLIVHGNGPQVGRLLADHAGLDTLDIHVAQTQGELGYLLAAALQRAAAEPVVALITRVEVDPTAAASGDPEKPIGPVLPAAPDGPALQLPQGRGWRRIVPSPAPRGVVEAPLIARLLDQAHVIAGGGGGVPVTADGSPMRGVIDKDRVAAWFAIRFDAAGLLIGTDVEGVYDDFTGPAPQLLTALTPAACGRLLDQGRLPAGSMGPKVASAVAYVTATGRAAVIARMGSLRPALAGRAGTRIARDAGSLPP
jgi:carbamate kinase